MAVAYIELDEYLALEAASRLKHEYLDGVIYAIQGEAARGMAGGSAAHADITRNAGFALHSRLKGSPCQVKMSDMRLRMAAAGAVFYPDVLVHCEPLNVPATATELTQARLIIEVLSPTTQQFDRGPKLLAYQQLAGLSSVILISSTEQAAWACSRGPDGTWSPLMPWARGTVLPVAGPGVDLPWDEVYEGVGLE